MFKGDWPCLQKQDNLLLNFNKISQNILVASHGNTALIIFQQLNSCDGHDSYRFYHKAEGMLNIMYNFDNNQWEDNFIQRIPFREALPKKKKANIFQERM